MDAVAFASLGSLPASRLPALRAHRRGGGASASTARERQGARCSYRRNGATIRFTSSPTPPFAITKRPNAR